MGGAITPQQRLALLSELDAFWPEAAAHPGGAPWLVAAQLRLLPALLEALRALERDPRQRALLIEGEAPLRRLRRPDRDALRWLARRPEPDRPLPTWGERPSAREHPANRYLAGLLWRLPRSLRGSAEALTGPPPRTERARQRAAARRALQRALLTAADEVEGALRASFLGDLRGAHDADEGALLAVLDDPRYARLHGLARRLHSPRLQLPQGSAAPPLGADPEEALYALWLLLALRQRWEARFPGVRWRVGGARRGDLRGLCLRADTPAGALLMGLALPFPALSWRGASPRVSLGAPARLALTLALRPPGGAPRWAFLDARWQIDSDGLQSALDELHRGCGALVWEPAGLARGALLVSPAQAASRHGAPSYLRGVLRASPGERLCEGIEAWMWGVLGVPGADLARGAG